MVQMLKTLSFKLIIALSVSGLISSGCASWNSSDSGHRDVASTRKASSGNSDELPFRTICPPGPFDGKLIIHQLYVGQGDSAIIRTPSGTIVLIDGGESPNYEKVIKPTLQNCYKTEKIDYIVLSHPHSDHFGGLLALTKDNTFTVRKFITGTTNMEKGETGSEFHQLITNAEKLTGAGAGTIGHGKSGGGVTLGNKDIVDSKVVFNVIVSNGAVLNSGPVPAAYESADVVRDDNSVSVGMLISFGKFKFFTGGDITGENTATGASHPNIESSVAKQVGQVDVYKASHHGSDTSNNQDILNALRPTNVIVSVGAGGKNTGTFHLPRKGAIERMNTLSSVENIFMLSAGASEDISADEMNSYRKVKNLGPEENGAVGSDAVVVVDEGGRSYEIYGADRANHPISVFKSK